MKVAQSCAPLCDSMDDTVHGILQARILEWVAFPFSRGSSQPRDQTQVSCIAGGFFTTWPIREAQEILEWVAYPFSSGYSWPRNRIRVFCIAGRFFTNWAIREATVKCQKKKKMLNLKFLFLAINIIQWDWNLTQAYVKLLKLKPYFL